MKHPKAAYDDILALLDNYIEKSKDVPGSGVNQVQTYRNAFVSRYAVQTITFKSLAAYVPTLAAAFSTTSSLRNDLLKAVASWPSHEMYLEWQVTHLKKQLDAKTLEASSMETSNHNFQTELAAKDISIAELQTTIQEQEGLLKFQGKSVIKTQKPRTLMSDYVTKLKAEKEALVTELELIKKVHTGELMQLVTKLELMKKIHTDELMQKEALMTIQTGAIDTLKDQLASALAHVHELSNPPRNYLTAATSGLKAAAPIAAAPAVTAKPSLRN